MRFIVDLSPGHFHEYVLQAGLGNVQVEQRIVFRLEETDERDYGLRGWLSVQEIDSIHLAAIQHRVQLLQPLQGNGFGQANFQASALA